MSVGSLLDAVAAAPTSDAAPPPVLPAPSPEPTLVPPATSPTAAPPPPPATTTVAPPPPVTVPLPPPVTENPAPSPTPDPDPSTGKTPPKTKTTKGNGGSGSLPTGSPGGGGSGGGHSGGGSSGGSSGGGTIGSGGNNSGTSTTDGSNSGSSPKSIIAPVIGGIAAVLVVGFLVGVFVMRYRKRSRANKRRLDILFDQNGQGQDQVHALGLGGASAAAGGAKHGRTSQSSIARPSTNEMSAIGGGTGAAAAAMHDSYDHGVYHNDGYPHEGGYDHASAQQYPTPYAGYQDPSQQPAYDAYDPYYGGMAGQQASTQLMPQQQQPPSGYYADTRTSPALAYQQPYGGGGSPSMTHSTASPPTSYPQPPISTSPSPRMPLLQGQAKSPQALHRNEMTPGGGGGGAGDYAHTQSSARNPQVVKLSR